MTAFASRECRVEEGTLRWELKSVNHRYLAVSPRLPEPLRLLEPTVRERIDSGVGRGKVDAILSYWPASSGAVAVDWAYADELIKTCQALAVRQDDAAAVSPVELLRMPGVVRQDLPDAEVLGEPALSLLDDALAELVASREAEGKRMAEVIGDRVSRVATCVDAIAARHPDVIAAIHERLRARLAALDIEAQPERLEQELALVAQRLDVDEELARLRSHCQAIHDDLGVAEPVGRRLDFLMQELNREANTLASKSADAETTRLAVDIRVYIEQMREQAQNIE